MMSTDPRRTDLDAADSLTTVARLLARALDMACDQAATDPSPALRFLGLGLNLATSQALELLPVSHDVDELAPVETDPLKLLRAAEELTRLHPIEDFPPGTSQLIATICDLLNEHAP
ncbi:hypothetical protein [Knoellia koreensis]|uniref:Uncharacterized protein n=1 Tax=Knoellia koreensis TaxID=2730921 RepID=A0A849HN66_9MICO|nr:hypothetical protein [Knoellia sp. DB2414S]NNM47821.1 hypothetical protein [Knoellia sp. DB2414S]